MISNSRGSADDSAFATLRRFYAGLTEYTFESRIGLADPSLIDYISELLTRFTFYDEIYRVRKSDGRPIEQVVDMLGEAETRPSGERREIHRHIGDFTLFWAGMYPEALRRMQAASRKDMFLDYPALGKRSYKLASRIADVEEPPENGILERLSHDYDLCLRGLTEVRKEWSRRDEETPPGLFGG
ncbi:MAG: hypothetical protein QM811_17060 [Pirellulales bacterium]